MGKQENNRCSKCDSEKRKSWVAQNNERPEVKKAKQENNRSSKRDSEKRKSWVAQNNVKPEVKKNKKLYQKQKQIDNKKRHDWLKKQYVYYSKNDCYQKVLKRPTISNYQKALAR